MRQRVPVLAALCLVAAALPATGIGSAQGLESARAAAEASARAQETARRTALRHFQEQRRRAAAHAGMPSTMYASTPDPATPDHPFPIHRATRRAPAATPKRHSVAADAVLPAAAQGMAFEPQRIWLFLGASETSGREGFLRVVNHSSQAGTVRIEAVDDAGTPAGPADLEIGPMQAIHLNSGDLEGGNAGKGLAEGLGPGRGDWRLSLTSALDVEALSYVRTDDGFVTSMHDTLAEREGTLQAAFLNPGSNYRQESLLRLVNPEAEDAAVRITGTDDAGQASGEVTVDLPKGAARTYTAAELEGGAAPGLSGALGDGQGKWRLRIESEAGIVAMSLLATPTGHLTNLSAPPPAADGDGTHSVPLFLSAAEPDKRQGFMRVVNRSEQSGTVRIQAFDQSDFAYEPVTLSLAPGQARHFNSTDLENGNPDKGLTGSTGAGRGDWRLELSSDLDFEAMAYVRTKEGFVTSMHDRVPATADGLLHRVAFLNPGSNYRQASRLLLANPGDGDAAVTIDGIDDAGASPGGTVRVRVPAGRTVSLDSAALEAGGDGFEGALGDGRGKWRLWVASDRPVLVASLLDTPTGDLANLSTAPGRGPERPGGGDAAVEAFRTLASPIVQSKCVNCHVAGGASGDTRLVFVPDTDADHMAINLKAFQNLLAAVDGGADYVLNKIQGVSHGGGVQVPAGTDEYDDMERFLGVLEGDGPDPVAITPGSLFDGVRMESKRSTLRRAAIVFAGRVPTEAEYESIETGGATSLRRAIRGLMTGPGFHEFLIRGANDRLLTDRDETVIDGTATDDFVDFSNLYYDKVRDHYDSGGPDPWRWYRRVQYGIGRAPLELIAHVVENDLPYTEVLTADYIMANPVAAAAYGAPASPFRDSGDDHEFQPSEIVSYYRDDDSKVSEFFTNAQNGMQATRVSDPGDLATDYPHAGILNTTAFLLRYPTTATNRNRARSRWTYYHFLGLDVEKSASRTTDPVALADTNNPTMHNPACTVCHSVLDPVAGAFQNYGAEGFYRDQWGGLDSLDGHYKADFAAGRGEFEVTALAYASRETVKVEATLPRGESVVRLSPGFDPPNPEDGEGWWNGAYSEVRVRNQAGVVVRRTDLAELVGVPMGSSDGEWLSCGTLQERHSPQYFEAYFCPSTFPIEVEDDGSYTVEVDVWVHADNEVGGRRRLLSVDVGTHQEGDTWYRDMRSPGFDGGLAPDPDNSLQWLAERITADPRFAEATVRFWWPTIMGDEVAEPPAEGDADFEGRLLASNAQSVEVARLARAFRQGFHGGAVYNLKDLLTELALSKWFRADATTSAGPVRETALASAGAKRLLTPEELSRKTLSLTGFGWRRWKRNSWEGPGVVLNWTNSDWEYGLLYGGIDSDGITKRGRDLTSVMAGVAERHAAATSCPVVMKDFYLLDEADRVLFRGADVDKSPVTEFSGGFEIKADSWSDRETFLLSGHLTAGTKRVALTFPNDHADDNGDRNVRLFRLDVLNANGAVVASRDLADLQPPQTEWGACGGRQWNSETGREDHFNLWSTCGPAFAEFDVPADGTYRIEVTAWADQYGDELARLGVAVESDTEGSAGSRAIRAKLAELHHKLLGVEADADSEDVRGTYDFFVEVWQRNRRSENRWFLSVRCDWVSDAHYFDGIRDEFWREEPDENGAPLGWDWDRVNSYFDSSDWSDPDHIARTWVAVLAHLMTDPRYLHL